jgi:FkbM family methyltransferase
MSRSIVQRLWQMSPRDLAGALRRRLSPPPAAPAPKWTRIAAGPLAGREMLLAPELGGSWREIAEGRFDEDMFAALGRHDSLEGAVVCDIGGHMGYHSMAFAALVGGSGRVLTFEPNPANRERLRANLDRNSELASRIEVVPCALSNVDGETEFVFSADLESGDSSCSFVDGALPPRGAESYSAFQRQRVPTRRLDTSLAERGWLLPKLMKIDVEGAEWLVLQGATELLRRAKPALLMEVHDIRLLFHIERFLLERGYQLEQLDDAHATASRCFLAAW